MGRIRNSRKYINETFQYIEKKRDDTKNSYNFVKKNPKCSEEYKAIVKKIEEEKRLNGDLENE